MKGHAKAKLITERIGSLAPKLLGRHVGGRPNQGPALGHDPSRRRTLELRVARQLQELEARQAKVHHAHAPVGADHDVVGLEVAVNHGLGMGRGEPPPGRHEHIDDLGDRAGRRFEPAAQRDALDVLHHDEGGPAIFPDLVDRHDVGMGELGHRLGLEN